MGGTSSDSSVSDSAVLEKWDEKQSEHPTDETAYKDVFCDVAVVIGTGYFGEPQDAFGRNHGTDRGELPRKCHSEDEGALERAENPSTLERLRRGHDTRPGPVEHETNDQVGGILQNEQATAGEDESIKRDMGEIVDRQSGIPRLQPALARLEVLAEGQERHGCGGKETQRDTFATTKRDAIGEDPASYQSHADDRQPQVMGRSPQTPAAEESDNESSGDRPPAPTVIGIFGTVTDKVRRAHHDEE